MIYGNHIAGDTLHNVRVGIYGIEVSFRFICDFNTTISHIRYYNIFSKDKPGYHLGTGGKIRIQIRENGDGNIPTDKVLATVDINEPLLVGHFPLLEFTKPCQLEADKIYHIVFSNFDAEPEKNHVSVNCMVVFEQKTQPFLRENDLKTLFKSRYNGWQQFSKDWLVPIFSLYNGSVPVLGYGGMESWVREPREISVNKKVRERFFSKIDLTVAGAFVRLGKNGLPKDLRVSLVNRHQSVIAKGTVSPFLVKSISTTIINGFRLGHDWVLVKFNKPAKVKKDEEHFILLENDGYDSYEIYPIRDGEQFGFNPLWKNSYAEYCLDGKNWRGWDAWGNPNQKIGKLQICLQVV